jgi:hypothetical protein
MVADRVCTGGKMRRLLTTASVLVLWFVVLANGQDNCRGFISTGCCCTANCCFEIDEKRDVVQKSGNTFMVVASGRYVERRGWSPDGHAYLCACDSVNGKWVPGLTANPRCLYLPMKGV